jgi:hypothetical protein
MGSDRTAAGLGWSKAGFLIMEDGLMYGRAINARSWTGDSGIAAFSSFECVVLFSLVGIVVSAALLLAAGPETVAAVTAGLAL